MGMPRGCLWLLVQTSKMGALYPGWESCGNIELLIILSLISVISFLKYGFMAFV